MIRRTLLLSLLLGVASAGALLTTPVQAAEEAPAPGVDLVIGAHGATFLPWEATEQTGNGYGVSVGLNVRDVRILFGYAGVLPVSTPQARFSVVWNEVQWHPFHEFFAELGVPLSPYVVLGVGVALPDDQVADDDEHVRWAKTEPQVMGLAGLGLAVGLFDGFFVSADMRMYNATYGGFVVTAGHCF